MPIHPALKSQYHAALKTLRLAIEACPDAKWNDPADGLAPFWRVAYHTLFFTHFYLQKDEASFQPWALHQPDAHALSLIHWDHNRAPPPATPTPATRSSNTAATGGGRGFVGEAQPSCATPYAGLMFWFRRKRLVGS